MPLWRIFSHPSTFTIDQKQALGESITSLYTTSHLPGFYVNVIFIPVEAENFYIAGKPVTDYVRIAIEHIAIHRPIEVRASMCAEIDKVRAFPFDKTGVVGLCRSGKYWGKRRSWLIQTSFTGSS